MRSRSSHQRDLPAALERWEDDGGSDGPIGAGLQPPREQRCLPQLPPGYSAQVAGKFHDRMGVVCYEFNRVYGRTEHSAHVPTVVNPLDEGMSYWASSWPVVDANGALRPTGRWLSYAEAHERLGVTYAQFSSVAIMQDRVGALLGP